MHRMRAKARFLLLAPVLLMAVGASRCSVPPQSTGTVPTNDLVLHPPPAGAPATVTGTDGRVWMADQNGRASVVRGFNIKVHDPSTIAAADLRQMTADGFTVLRLAVFWSDMEPTQGHWNEAYFTNVARCSTTPRPPGWPSCSTCIKTATAP